MSLLFVVAAVVSNAMAQCDLPAHVTYAQPTGGRYGPVYYGPSSFVDLDADGDLDMLGGDSYSSELWWRYNDGRGAFGARFSVDVGERFGEPMVADLDADGLADVAVLTQIGTGASTQSFARVLYGRPGGFLAPSAPIDIGRGYRQHRLADLDGDGLPDLVSTGGVWNRSPAQLFFLRNLGTRMFGTAVATPLPDGPYYPRFDDHDHDGILDLIVVCSTGDDRSSIANMHGLGNGRFGPPRVVHAPSNTYGPIDVGDLNADGNLDLVTRGDMHFLLGDGTGGFGTPTPLGLYARSYAVSSISDLNGDGLLDVVGNDVAVVARLGLGNALFGPSFVIRRERYSDYCSALFADLNGDHRQDYVYCGGLYLSEATPTLPIIDRLAGTDDAVLGFYAGFVVEVHGTVPFQFAWFKDGLPLVDDEFVSGSSTPYLELSRLRFADSGQYSVRITNPCGSIVSRAVPLSVRNCVHRPSGGCGDIDDGTGTGVPDGGTTIDDLLYFLSLYEAGDPGADFDDGSMYYGCQDGGVTIDDLLYYLWIFEHDC